MVNTLLSIWCKLFGHGRAGYTVHSGNVVRYCKRCRHEIKLDKRGSIW